MPRLKTTRDSQMSKVYEAERDGVPDGQKFKTIAEVERYLKSAFARKRFRQRYPEASGFDVQNGQGHSHACGWGRAGVCHMKLPTWARTELIVLHELAHGLARLRHGARAIGGHGREFCAIYLDLVTRFMGKDAGQKLKAAFSKHRVKFRPRRQGRPLSAEQRAAACARLAQARAARPASRAKKEDLWAQHQQKVRRAAQVLLDECYNSCNPDRHVVVRVRRSSERGYPYYDMWHANERAVEANGAAKCRKFFMRVSAEEINQKVTEYYQNEEPEPLTSLASSAEPTPAHDDSTPQPDESPSPTDEKEKIGNKRS